LQTIHRDRPSEGTAMTAQLIILVIMTAIAVASLFIM
jgi:hypothetical protein